MTERVSPEMYHRVFVGHHEGALVLEDLVGRFFDIEVYVKGGPEAARETEARAARRDVVRHILTMCTLVAQPDTNAELPPAA